MPYVDGPVQDCSISSALALEILQSCTEPSMLCTLTSCFNVSLFGSINYILPLLCMNEVIVGDRIDEIPNNANELWTIQYSEWTAMQHYIRSRTAVGSEQPSICVFFRKMLRWYFYTETTRNAFLFQCKVWLFQCKVWLEQLSHITSARSQSLREHFTYFTHSPIGQALPRRS